MIILVGNNNKYHKEWDTCFKIKKGHRYTINKEIFYKSYGHTKFIIPQLKLWINYACHARITAVALTNSSIETFA
jgi:hypothetical protein